MFNEMIADLAGQGTDPSEATAGAAPAGEAPPVERLSAAGETAVSGPGDQDLEPPPTALGVRIGGSAREGHTVALLRQFGLSEVFGTREREQVTALLSHCLLMLNGVEAGDLNDSSDQRHFMLSAVRDLAPRDAAERMLAVQMAATHVALVRAGQHLAKASSLAHVEAHSTAFNKLARTYTAQMEALRKHRNGGQQKVRVEHVHVHAGGQAIVGEVHHGGRGAKDEG